MSGSPSVIISLDAELLWGFDEYDEFPLARVQHGREAWAYLLELFEDADIPATWAVVGHLFFDSCDGVHADHRLVTRGFPAIQAVNSSRIPSGLPKI